MIMANDIVLLIYLYFLYGIDGHPLCHRRPQSEKEHHQGNKKEGETE